jgi:glycolate oxidase
MLAIFTDPVAAMSVVPRVAKSGINPTSIEYMDNANVRTTSQFLDFAGAPHVEDGIYVIFTIETFNEDELDMKMEQLAGICEDCGAIDVLEADDRIWAMRRNCLESVRLVSLVCTTDDVVVPVDEVSDMIKYIIATVKKYPFPLRINAHIGDGNLHIVLCKLELSNEEWESNLERFTQEIYTYVYAHGGRLSGEHGIGAKKRDFLERFTPAGELALMRKIKRAWDPNNILNPGKVFNA